MTTHGIDLPFFLGLLLGLCPGIFFAVRGRLEFGDWDWLWPQPRIHPDFVRIVNERFDPIIRDEIQKLKKDQ